MSVGDSFKSTIAGNIKTIVIIAVITRFLLAYLIHPDLVVKSKESHAEAKANLRRNLFLARARKNGWKKNANLDITLVKANVTRFFEERRKTVEQVCAREYQRGNQLLQESNMLHGKRWNMYFDYYDGLMVCTIDKVSSTTLLYHFKNLAMTRYPEFVSSETSRDETRDFFYSLNTGSAKSVEEASQKLVTAAFVRHPLHRLASAYRDKIGRGCTRFFPPIRKMIIESYRKPMALMKSRIHPISHEWLPFPTPHEFAQYIVDEIPKMGDVLNVNRHFAAQYTQCPFCSLPFDIVGTQETFASDIKITFENVNLVDQCNVSMAQNKHGGDDSFNEQYAMNFYSQIPKTLNWKIFKYYELDFDLFGYDKEEALKFVEAGLDDEPT